MCLYSSLLLLLAHVSRVVNNNFSIGKGSFIFITSLTHDPISLTSLLLMLGGKLLSLFRPFDSLEGRRCTTFSIWVECVLRLDGSPKSSNKIDYSIHDVLELLLIVIHYLKGFTLVYEASNI